ncbi:mechanosensitive ion channel family protein [Pelagovum sp. HNIBRBA483]|uniref:mechanosensitive ion channel family protein n=1 Tax=Pelagovum sp. HNIBRBA483 TaxID=3233341 RepID=UPI0034A326F2
MEKLLSTEIWAGQTLANVLTVDFFAGVMGNILAALLILLAGMFVAGWARKRIMAVGSRFEQLDNTLFNFLANITRYVILGFAFLFVLNTFGIQTTSFVAVIGAAGLAVGLALQGTLSNVAAGVMIILFRPFKLGDFVEVGGQMGTVKDISLNFIELATAANVQVIVPNAQVWGNTITNYSVYSTRRAEWLFGVGYGADLKKAEAIIRRVVLEDPRALAEPTPFIQVNNLGDFSVDFLVRVWCNSGDLFQFQADMKRAVKEAFDAEGIDIPFPTQTVIRQDETA